jgi:hypothetical protein
MGAVNFSLDRQLVASLQSVLALQAFVETGTFKGDTVAALESCFDKIISIELSDSLWENAVERFRTYPHIRILHGDSTEKLRGLHTELQDVGALYWLDAHWCAANATAGEFSQCPLLDELLAITKLNSNSIILIDDARLFLAPPLAPHEISQWPALSQIISGLSALSNEHELMVINDVIAFFPTKARAAMVAYAQLHGVDWLSIMHSRQPCALLESQLLEKENIIRELASSIEDKEALIKQQAGTIRAYQKAYGSLLFLRPFVKIIRGAYEIVRPRLGNLNQYSPRPLAISKREAYKKSLTDYPKISIVTPSFGQGKFIERTILSILDQQYPNLEYFVQDGGSMDGTLAILEKYQSALSGWVSEKDGGQSHAINQGFARTSGDVMGWLNSDDLLLPDTLKKIADFFNRYPEVDVVYGDRLLIDEDDMEIGRWIMPSHDNEILSWVDYVPQETLFWRRRIWDRVGGHVDESYKFAMDWDLLVRFREAGATFSHIPEFFGAFRIHEQQKTSAAINEIGCDEMTRIRERLLGRVPAVDEIRKAALPYLLKHIVVDMKYRIKTRLGISL